MNSNNWFVRSASLSARPPIKGGGIRQNFEDSSDVEDINH